MCENNRKVLWELARKEREREQKREKAIERIPRLGKTQKS